MARRVRAGAMSFSSVTCGKGVLVSWDSGMVGALLRAVDGGLKEEIVRRDDVGGWSEGSVRLIRAIPCVSAPRSALVWFVLVCRLHDCRYSSCLG